MDDFDYWRLCDDLSVYQAALLVVGVDPAVEAYVEHNNIEKRPYGYEAAKSAIINALKRDSLVGALAWESELDQNGNEIGPSDNVNVFSSTVSVQSLRFFLKKRGISTGFFFQDHVEDRNYLNPENSCFAPKLAAAVAAWEAVSSNPSLFEGKTVKQALEKWLREHASEYGLTGTDGNPVGGAIEQISKVANWRPEGGAAKTPTAPQVDKTLPPNEFSDDLQYDTSDIEAGIPF
ncbi:MAG: hypothetical protein RIM33_04875 [Alphaproteobacteria bacterium]